VSKVATEHPGDERLLRFLDGELAARDASQVRKHLDACWECRAELKEIEQTIGDCVRYRKMVLESSVPPAPAPWVDIYQRFSALDEADKQRHFTHRAGLWLGRVLAYPRPLVSAAVMVLLIAVVVQQLRDTPSVRAAELLRKAIAASESRPRTARRIQIRMRSRRLTRVIGSAQSFASSRASSDEQTGLESLFRAAHYNWEDPLSAKSYSDWRDQLPEKRDEITSDRDEYRLRTTTSSGELVEATLKFDSHDLRAIEGILQFRNSERVEISELSEAPAVVASAPRAEASPIGTVSSQPAKPDAAVELTPGDELQVFAALHRAGADLGDPVDVTRSGAHIAVTGVGISTDRQRKIRDELRALPQVTLRFSDPSNEPIAPDGRNSSAISVNPGAGPLQIELAKQLGGRAGFEQFADQVLELTDAFMARAHALRRLAERFSPDLEAQISPQERQLLQTMRREHTEPLLRNVVEVQDRLLPVLAAVPTQSSETPPLAIAPNTWQDATEQMFREAHRTEGMLVTLLGATAGENQSPELPAQVLASLKELRYRVEDYARLTTPP
jgi:Putative zinc-finger